MGLLLNVGFKQIKNYIKHNKFKCFLVTAFILLMIVPYIFMFVFVPETSSYDINNYYRPPIALFSLGLSAAAGFIALSFANAETLMISRAEANIFFVSPIKEQNIMTYILLKSSYQIIFILIVFTGFNLSYMVPYYRIPADRFIFLILWEFLILSTYLFLASFLFIIKKKNQHLFYSIAGALIVIAGTMASVFLVNLKHYSDLFGELNIFLTNPLWGYIPIIGWLANATSLFYGFDLKATISVILLIIVNIFFFLSPKLIHTSIAEAAIDASEKYHKRIQRQRKGNKIELKPKEVKESETVKGSGWTAIISKQWIDYKRSSRFFVSSSVITQIFIMIIYVIVYKMSLSDLSEEGLGSINGSAMMALFFILVITIVSIMMPSELSKDANHPMIMLIPEKPYKKLLAISIMSNFENAVRAVSIIVFAVMLDVNVLLSLFLSLIYFLCVSTASYVDMFFNCILKDNIFSMFRMTFGAITKIIVLFIFVIVYICFAYIFTGSTGFNFISFPALLITFLLAGFIDFILVFASQSVMDNVEK